MRSGHDLMIAELPATHIPRLRYQPLKSGEIRLLLLQPGQEDDPIRFSLVHSTIKASQDKFAALSYTWGDPLNRQSIECNEYGEKTFLTQNCARAIRRLRSFNEQKLFWIDAICINQNDLLEREEQVMRMGDIYRFAAEVIIYLGEEKEQSCDAMSFIDSLDHQNFHAPLDLYTKDALSALLYRPWFNRIWVLQEVHNAKQVRLVCGQSEARWSDLLLYKWWHHLGRRDLDTWPLVMFVRDRSRYGPNDFLRLLLQARKCGATDPRDKVYAILPMIREERVKLPRPNYTLPKEEVYLETASCLSNFGLEFLCAVSHPSGTLGRAGLPSWVPRWDEGDGCMLIWPDTGRAATEEIELNRFGDVIHNPYKINDPEFYQAGGNRGQYAPHTHEIFVHPGMLRGSSRLKVRGTCVALITALSAPIAATLEDIQSPSSSFRSLWKGMRPQTCHGRYLDRDAEFRFAQHPLHQSINAAIAHKMWERLDSIKYHTRTMDGGLQWIVSRNETRRNGHTGQIMDMHMRREASGIYQQWREEVLGLINGRRISIVADGGMGMAPTEARVGDSVCILYGAPVPFVLRRVERDHGEEYALVGPCYLNGMMTSDGFEKLRTERHLFPRPEDGPFERDFVLC